MTYFNLDTTFTCFSTHFLGRKAVNFFFMFLQKLNSLLNCD